MSSRPDRTGKGPVAVGAAAVLAVLCCFAPGLLAGATLAGIGASLDSAWFLTAAALLVIAGSVGWLARRPSRRSERSCVGACCPPPDPAASDPGRVDDAQTSTGTTAAPGGTR